MFLQIKVITLSHYQHIIISQEYTQKIFAPILLMSSDQDNAKQSSVRQKRGRGNNQTKKQKRYYDEPENNQNSWFVDAQGQTLQQCENQQINSNQIKKQSDSMSMSLDNSWRQFQQSPSKKLVQNDQKKEYNSDEDDWDMDDKSHKDSQQVSMSLVQQVQKDSKDLDTSWMIHDNDNDKSQQKQSAKSRGNRGNRANRDSQNTYQSNNRANRDSKNTYQSNKRGNRDPKNTSQPNQRGNRNNRGNNNRDQQQQNLHSRGNRQNRDQRNQDAYHGGFKKKDFYDNGKGGYQRQDKDQRNYMQKYDHNKDNFNKNKGNRIYQQKSYDDNRNYKRNQQKSYHQYQNKFKQTSKQPQFEQSSSNMTNQQTPLIIEPQGQKCWPQITLFVKGAKVSFTYRRIIQHVSDVLVIPYKDLTFSIYPGNIVNKFDVDYRAKLSKKSQELKDVGSICIQKCIGLKNFKALGFMKIGHQKQVSKCFANLFSTLKRVKDKIKTIVIPYSAQIGHPNIVIRSVVEQLTVMNEKVYTQIYLSTNKEQNMKVGMKGFYEQILRLTENNQIAIQQ